jgi:hypothetical protein
MYAARVKKQIPTTCNARCSFRSRSRTLASTNIRQSKTDPDVTSMKLSIPNPTREILLAISPVTTAIKPSIVFQTIVKYSSAVRYEPIPFD